MKNELVDLNKAKKASMILRAANHKLRQQIMNVINESGRITVTDIYVKVRVVQSLCSQHLAILRRAKIVETEKIGKCVYYKINKETIADINLFVDQLLNNENKI
jgi:DNA-binding transcriptional ArsR family regulator